MPKLTAEQWEKKAQIWSEQAAESKTFQHLRWCVKLAQHCIHKANLAKIAEEEQTSEHTIMHEVTIEEEEEQAIQMIETCIHKK